jgi:hypothetical protein
VEIPTVFVIWCPKLLKPTMLENRVTGQDLQKNVFISRYVFISTKELFLIVDVIHCWRNAPKDVN